MKKFLFSILSISILHFGYSQTSTPEFISSNKIDDYIKEAIEKWQIPGISVGIVKDGKLVYAKGFGESSLGSGNSVSKNTLFMIGSNSKAFTGTALAMLEYEGKCDLNDPVKKWYPRLKMKDQWLDENLSLTDIVTHRVGMETFQGDFMYWDSDLMEHEIIEKFGQLTPMYAPRTKWGYCNAGYVLAGKCIQEISGTKWHSYLNNTFFNPLNMNHTYCYVSDLEHVSNVAKAHTIENGKVKVIPYGSIDNIAPAGAITSNVEDMSHWLIMQLNNGKYNGEQIIPQEVIQKTRTPFSIVGQGSHPFNTSHFDLYSLGWGLQDYEGREVVSHTGGINGFVTSVTMIPDENLGILVFTNTDQNYLFEALKWEIIDAYLELPFRDYSNTYYSFFERKHRMDQQQIEAWQDSVKQKNDWPTDIKNFEGTYSHEVYGTIECAKKGKALELTFQHHPNLKASLEYMGNNRFLCTYSDILFGVKVFPFTTEGDQVKSFTLSVADFLEFTTYEFIKQ
ncbi:MAG: serine hydrolase [Schleiferiaceae bacterium]|jgi:CubicO group peptidase (beta-lactamase class C family)|nr:serine hydrolase [Schleiferiaceae bacterium]